MSGGRLRVTFDSTSGFLHDNLPVEVRDAEYRLVKRAKGSLNVAVPKGLYIVEATLPGGSRHSQVVEVKADAPTDVLLTGAAAETSTTVREDYLPAAEPVAVPAILLEHRACELRQQVGSTWTFEPAGDPEETPMATFEVAGSTISASLPVNPAGQEDERAAVIRFKRRGQRIRADVGFAPNRRVAWTLQGLLNSGNVVSTAEVFRDAEEVLFYKYDDPSAAALGGLTLHRIGRLGHRFGWVENLARDFPWVIDGRVLMAALLAKADRQTERERGLEMLLDAAARRPLFSDGLALLMKLLRAWPDGSASDDRRRVLATITSDPMTVDWDAMALTMYGET